MSIAAILIGLALLIMTIPVVAGPVVNKQREKKFLADTPDGLEERTQYQQALLALRDLDFDHRLGMVGDEDHAMLRAQLLAEAAQARETAGKSREADLDTRIETAGESREVDLDTRIEAAVRARRRQPPVKLAAGSLACYHCGAEMAADDKFCADCGSRAAVVCPHCGHQTDPGDKFCAGCGMNLAVGVVA